MTADHATLAARAQRLLDLHRPGDPLVLVNAWDVASAAVIERAGARAIATSSAAIAASVGEVDDDRMDVDVAFDVIRRIAGATSLPVTADIEAGYGLDAVELVDRLMAAGAVGCNLEDSDHAVPGTLVDAEAFAMRLGEIRAAADAAGVHVVLNARIDTLLHGGAGPEQVEETLARARAYLAAGADCTYPIRLTQAELVRRLVAGTGAPLNANLAPGGLLADLARAGAARVSIGPTAHRSVLAHLAGLAGDLLQPVNA
jgi:2-methylisocitrate lyase-like PEP mutase family enzyme